MSHDSMENKMKVNDMKILKPFKNKDSGTVLVTSNTKLVSVHIIED
jgi:hypothetical protein